MKNAKLFKFSIHWKPIEDDKINKLFKWLTEPCHATVAQKLLLPLFVILSVFLQHYGLFGLFLEIDWLLFCIITAIVMISNLLFEFIYETSKFIGFLNHRFLVVYSSVFRYQGWNVK
jgi:hypothetical protein